MNIEVYLKIYFMVLNLETENFKFNLKIFNQKNHFK